MKQQKSYHKLLKVGKLFLVPTPIGNLEDMTFRGIQTLKDADVIASEDTRNTQKLLNHFDISTKQISFHEHNYKERIPQLLEKLHLGEMIAQVSDAGMPSISDPGYELVKECIVQDIPVIALPGATAGVTALIASGIAPQPFLFFGFLPRKKAEIHRVLENLQVREETIIFYESPHRVKQTLLFLEKVFGQERQVVLCRELTKLYEEYTRGTIAEVALYAAENEIKGECCLIVAGAPKDQMEDISWQKWTIEEHVEYVMGSLNLPTKEAIKQVAKERNVAKQLIYKAYHTDA